MFKKANCKRISFIFSKIQTFWCKSGLFPNQFKKKRKRPDLEKVDKMGALNLVVTSNQLVCKTDCQDKICHNSCYYEAHLNSCYDKAGRNSRYDEASCIGILLKMLHPDGLYKNFL